MTSPMRMTIAEGSSVPLADAGRPASPHATRTRTSASAAAAQRRVEGLMTRPLSRIGRILGSRSPPVTGPSLGDARLETDDERSLGGRADDRAVGPESLDAPEIARRAAKG